MSYKHMFKFHGADICHDTDADEYVAFWTYQTNVGWPHMPEIVNETVEIARAESYSALYWPLVEFLQKKGILPVILEDEEDIV